MFAVRLVKADHYMCSPLPGLDVTYSHFRASEVRQVPIVRIFGSTVTGKKVCLHIHGAFPYLYIPYDGKIEKKRFTYQIAAAIDKALNISLGNSTSFSQHVYNISVVSGIPFYGYHGKNHQFLKIYFYNPLLIKKASELLQNGVILGQVFQPHEAHIPFILQFCIDYNLHGMSYVHLLTVRYRQGTMSVLASYSNVENVPKELLVSKSVARISTCSLEVDAVAADILNNKEVSGSATKTPGLKAIWEEECERMRAFQVTPDFSQPRLQFTSTSSEKFHLERLQKRLVQLDLLKDMGDNLETSLSREEPLPHSDEASQGDKPLEASFLLVPSLSLKVQKQLSGNTHGEEEKSVIVDGNKVLHLSSDMQTNLSQSADESILNSQCQSLVQVLQKLVEEDSILGSQCQHFDETDSDTMDGESYLSHTLNDSEIDLQYNESFSSGRLNDLLS